LMTTFNQFIILNSMILFKSLFPLIQIEYIETILLIYYG